MTEKTKKTKKTEKTPDGVKVVKEFMFKLTNKEAAERYHAAGTLHAEVQKLEEEFAELKRNWKAKIDARTASRDDLLVAGETGEEKRTVEATMTKNYDIKEIAYWFEGKVVERRTMTETELQMEANFEKKQKNERAKKQMLDKTEKHDPVAEAHKANGKDPEIAQVHKLETTRGTKHSSVDGPKIS